MTSKVIRFLPVVPPVDQRIPITAWSDRTVAPERVTLATAFDLPGLPPPRFAAVEIVWPDDDAAGAAPDDGTIAGRREVPQDNASGPAGHRPQDDPAAPPDHSPPNETPAASAGLRDDGVVVVAVAVDQVVVRGTAALNARWAETGERFKMMSFGRRNPALTRAEFVERWRAEAGRLGGDRIPDEVRGLAYVQDHPRDDDPPFDAINEVWFDRLDDLRRRAEWFAARPIPADLMSPADCWSLYLRETVVVPTRR